MPTTNRGYPYETPADEPGWSVTGGSDGSQQILAQVLDADVTDIVGTINTNAAGAAAALAAHAADTTAVHGIADTADLVVTTDARLSDARTPTAHAATHAAAGVDPITAASIDAYPDTGGALDGDLTLTEHAATVRSTDGLNAWRAAAAAGVVALETVGVVDVVSYAGADFTSTATPRQRWSPTGTDFSGVTGFGTLGAPEQSVHPDGYGTFGGKNGVLPVQICGRTNTSGAPVAGDWAAGDIIIDLDGVLHLCTADGTPGTWT
jgi:hypothetical protein